MWKSWIIVTFVGAALYSNELSFMESYGGLCVKLSDCGGEFFLLWDLSAQSMLICSSQLELAVNVWKLASLPHKVLERYIIEKLKFKKVQLVRKKSVKRS